MAISKSTKEEVYKMVNEQGMTIEEVAQIRGVSRTTIVDYLSRYEKDRVCVENNTVEGPIHLCSNVEMDETPFICGGMAYPMGKSTPVPTSDAIDKLEELVDAECLQEEYDSLMSEYSKEVKSKQKLMDSNRILRAERRGDHRIDNSVVEFSKELIELNKEYGVELSKISVPKISKRSKKVGVMQISDWHSNEVINLPNNQYDFEILAKRAKKFTDEAIFLFEAHGIDQILLASTGDMLNSDRRLDELLNQAVNRSKATILVQHIITQMIMHLRLHFNVHVVSVLGNESRVGEDWHSSNNVVSDNYDFTIFANIKEKFEFANIDGITFGEIDKMETIVNINGQRWLLVHDTGRVTDTQKGTQSKIGSYYLKGTPIDFVIGGHIHASRSTDMSSRSSSMAGSNEYNEHKMGLVGTAAQTLFIVGEKDRQSIIVNLQHVEGCDGYDVIEKLKAYNAKSADKLRDKTTILEIRV